MSETYTRVFLDRKIFVSDGEGKRGDRTHSRNNSNRNQNSCHIVSLLTQKS